MSDKQWRLSIGIHKGTLMSRDTDNRTFNSLEECKRDVRQTEENMARIGYYIWFAKAYGPDGEEIKLHEGTPYRS
jgi:hypothetical protein